MTAAAAPYLETQVLIAGAGPVGLVLAIDLGRRGIRCILAEKNDAPLGWPKMERCNPRTMEIFRRLGIAEKVRAAGYPADWPMDAFIVTNLMQEPLLRMEYPSVADAKARRDATLDGSLPLEPYQIISQYTLEPLLKSVAEGIANVDVRFGHEFVSFEQDADGVTSLLRKSNGTEVRVRSQYLAGCDGGASVVRKQLGFQLEGESLMEMRQALFHCPTLYDTVPAPRGRHYHRVDKHWTFLIVQDSRKHFTVHAVVDTDDDMKRMFEQIVGAPIEYETLHIGKWTQRLMLASGYMTDRVFIAGDAAHLVIPTGGLGMNTGVGDAIDLSWKLAATLQGWGGPNLLPAYEAERRPVGARNVQASGQGTRGRLRWREAYRPWIEDDTPAGKEARDNLVQIAKDEAPKSFRVVGAELGYRYAGSPIICDEPGAPESSIARYEPTSWPGSRLPHVWIEPGEISVHDRIGDGYTLIRLGAGKTDATELSAAFKAIGAPFATLDIDHAGAREVYGFDYLLVRPDLHVVWRADAPPADPGALARIATGH